MVEPFSELEALASARGRNAKLALMATMSSLARALVLAAVDPWRCYYVTAAPPAPTPGLTRGAGAAELILAALERLATGSLRGAAARDLVSSVSVEIGEVERVWFERIVRRRLGCSVGATLANAAWPGSLRRFELPLCETLEARFGDAGRLELVGRSRPTWPSIVEPKLDGIRIYAVRSGAQWTLVSRNGEIVETMAGAERDLAAAIPLALGDVALHGEAFDGSWAASTSAVLSRKKRAGGEGAPLWVFDMELLSAPVEPLSLRRSRLESLLSATVYPALKLVSADVASSELELFAIYERWLDKGAEGVVVKDPGAVPHVGRSRSWLKLKPKATWEGVVVRSFLGRPGTRLEGKLGGFVFKLPGSDAESEVGSGFSDDDRATLGDCVGRWIEVEGQPPLTPDGRVRFPVFVRFRDPRDLG